MRRGDLGGVKKNKRIEYKEVKELKLIHMVVEITKNTGRVMLKTQSKPGVDGYKTPNSPT